MPDAYADRKTYQFVVRLLSKSMALALTDLQIHKPDILL